MVLSISRSDDDDDRAGRGTVHEDSQSFRDPSLHARSPMDRPRSAEPSFMAARLDFDGPVVADGGGDI